jgi:hypothetical protein
LEAHAVRTGKNAAIKIKPMRLGARRKPNRNQWSTNKALAMHLFVRSPSLPRFNAFDVFFVRGLNSQNRQSNATLALWVWE